MVAAMAMTVAVAQGDNNSNKHRRGPKPMDATEMTNRMSEKLGLDDKQKAKVLELNKDFVKTQKAEMEEHKAAKEDMKKGMVNMRKNHEKYEKQLKKILTDDQYKQYQQMHKRRGGPRPGKGFGGPGGPGPRPEMGQQPQAEKE